MVPEGIHVHIDAQMTSEIASIDSPTHKISTQVTGNKATVMAEDAGIKLDILQKIISWVLWILAKSLKLYNSRFVDLFLSGNSRREFILLVRKKDAHKPTALVSYNSEQQWKVAMLSFFPKLEDDGDSIGEIGKVSHRKCGLFDLLVRNN